MINVEEKYADAYVSGVTTSSSGAVDYLLPVAQGVGVGDRVGNSIRCQQLDFSILCVRNGTDGNVRCIIFRDSENQGTTPTTASIFQNTGTTLNIVSPINWLNKNANAEKNRYVILMDETFTVDANNTNVIGNMHFPQSSMKHARFRGSTNGAASAAEGALFICVITDQSANQPLVTWYSRVTYTDD